MKFYFFLLEKKKRFVIIEVEIQVIDIILL